MSEEQETVLDVLSGDEFTSVWEELVGRPGGLEETSSLREQLNTSGRFADWSTASKAQLPTLHRQPDASSELRVIARLGVGGMGEVFLAEQESIGREVAIKVLHRDQRDAQQSNKLLHEARIAGRLEHPNIVPVHSLGVDDEGFPLYVMKRVLGVPWSKAIRHPDRLPSCFTSRGDDLEAHLEIFERVCTAVHFAHSRGMLHLDLKPANVMLGEHDEVLLVDWGIAVSMNEDDRGELPMLDELDSPCGTPGYMAPEMASLQYSELGARTDVYQLGAILHYILTRKVRNRGKDLRELLKLCVRGGPYDYEEDVPEELARICNEATARWPDDRPRSAEALRGAVARFRTQREADHLLDMARRSLGEFREVLAQPERPEQSSEAYRLYGELRFALRRAMSINPGASGAGELQRETLCLMFGFELERDNLGAVRQLERELQGLEGHQERALKLAALEQAHAARSSKLEEFEQMKHQLDASQSSSNRAFIVASLALFWGAVAAASRLLWTYELLAYTPTTIIAVKGFNTLIGLGCIAIAQRMLSLNRINRQMLWTFGAALAAGFAVRAIFLLNELPVHLSLAMETLVYLMCVVGVAIFVTPVLFGGALCFAASIAGVLAFPEWAWGIMIGCNMTGLLVIGLSWSRRRVEQEE